MFKRAKLLVLCLLVVACCGLYMTSCDVSDLPEELPDGIISDHVHTWNDWIVFTEPECRSGLKARDCSICGTVDLKIMPPEHEYVDHEGKEASCTAIGWTGYRICSLCGDTNYEQTDALGHSGEWVVKSEATCTESGLKAYECERCGLTLDTEVIAAAGHVSDGEKCTNCGLEVCDITVKYVYADGSSATEDAAVSVWCGESYSVNSPVIEGFVADKPIVSGTAEGDLEITVTYSTVSLQTITRIDLVELGAVPYGTPFSELPLPSSVKGYTSSGAEVNLNVYWNSIDYNPEKHGNQTISGIAFAGYGYHLSCSNRVMATLTTDTIVIESIKEMDLGRLPMNTSYAGLGLPTTAPVATADGSVYYAPVTWSYYDYDASVAGEHRITGYVTLESGFTFAEGAVNEAVITFELSEAMYGTADIVFLVDTTGSMWGEIQNVKNNIARFAERLESEGVSVRWALLEYRDITCDGADSTKIIYCGASEWYIDVTAYEAALSSLTVNGGGDREETVIDALKAATYLDSREAAKTFYIVVTDADYKTNNNHGVSGMPAMINQLAAAETVTSVVTKDIFYGEYRALTDGTGGILANIDGDFASELWRLCDLITEDVVYGDVERIEIVSKPNKTSYLSGDYFDGSGMIVRAYYTSGLSRDITGYSVSPYTALQLTDTEIEINYRGKCATVAITVEARSIPTESVELSADSLTLTVGETATVTATVYPTDAVNPAVMWYTENPNVAVVNNGVIEAVGVGETIIAVFTLDGLHYDYVTVTVNARPVAVEGIYTDKGAAQMAAGSTLIINATVLPYDATNKELIWSSSNTSVATVNASGLVYAVSAGNATITVTTADGGYKAMVYIVVVAEMGNVSGRVYSASGSSLLSGVTVKIYKDSVLVATDTTDSYGNYDFTNLVYGTYEITYAKNGYLTATKTYTVSSRTAQIDNTYLTANTSTLPGKVSGYAQNALTGYGVGGITVNVRSGNGNKTGTVIQTVTTSSSGYYITNNLTPGYYTLEFVDNRTSTTTHFTTGYLNVAVTGNTTSTNKNISLSAPMAAGTMRIVLTWGSSPSDLDSHLLINGSSYHIFYSNKSPSGSGANLDVDDRNSYGPETITVTSMKSNGKYTYYVHNWSGGSLSALTNSGAVVKVYIGSECYEFNAPTGSGYYWNVFSYNAATGEFTVNNKIVTSEPTA